MQHINKLVVIGVGLIGGSCALAWRQAGLVTHILGVERTPQQAMQVEALGIVDACCCDLAAAVHDADVVLLATPVGQITQVLSILAPVLPAQCLVMDVGSSKADVVDLMTRYMPQHTAYCVPAHPLAGSEHSGPGAARADLFTQRTVVLTPLPETAPAALARAQALWEATAARVTIMDAQTHDRILAVVSHVPHVLSFAYIDWVRHLPDAEHCFALAATGFRDFTRIAGSHPEMWRDICLSNRAPLLEMLQSYRTQLEQLIAHVDAGDAPALDALFAQARQARVGWVADFQSKH